MGAIDNFGKIMFDKSQRDWLLLHYNYVQRYLDAKVDQKDHDQLYERFAEKPYLGKALAEDFRLLNEQKIRHMLRFFGQDSIICLLIGRRGGGKTAFAFWLAEQVHENYPKRPIAAMQTSHKLPDWISPIELLEDAPEKAFIIYDEAAIMLNSRSAMTSLAKETSKILAI